MPGMGKNNVSLLNPIVVTLFRHHLYVSSVYWIIGIALVVLLVATFTGRLNTFNVSRAGLSEPRSRTILRIGFGIIWVFDGILQFQPSMPLGLANDVVRPAVSGAPSWLHPLMLHSIALWNAHPINLATGTAWIQVGIGLALISSNAAIGRYAAVVAAGWAALVWIVGEGAGGAFASGASILFGWPGATLFYCAAAVWIALPPGYFADHYSRWTLRVIAVVLLVAAVLQCLPSAQFWHGGNNNALTAMTRSMTVTAQPHGSDVGGSTRGRSRRDLGRGIQRRRYSLAARRRGRALVRQHPRGGVAHRHGHRGRGRLLGGGRGHRRLRRGGHGHQLANPPRPHGVLRATRAARGPALSAPPARGVSLEHRGGRGRLRLGHDSLLRGLDGHRLGVGRGAHALCGPKRSGGARQHQSARLHPHRPTRSALSTGRTQGALHPLDVP